MKWLRCSLTQRVVGVGFETHLLRRLVAPVGRPLAPDHMRDGTRGARALRGGSRGGGDGAGGDREHGVRRGGLLERVVCLCVDVTWKREKSGDCDCNE